MMYSGTLSGFSLSSHSWFCVEWLDCGRFFCKSSWLWACVSLVVSCLDPVCSCDVWLVRVSDASKHRCKSRDFLDSICRVLLFPVCYNLRNWQRHKRSLRLVADRPPKTASICACHNIIGQWRAHNEGLLSHGNTHSNCAPWGLCCAQGGARSYK